MTVIDTSVWILFFKGDRRVKRLSGLCAGNLALLHPWVFGELLLGGLSAENRELVESLDRCVEPSLDQLAEVIRLHGLSNKGIGLVDTAVLHGALSAQAAIWTYDSALRSVARETGVDLYAADS